MLIDRSTRFRQFDIKEPTSANRPYETVYTMGFTGDDGDFDTVLWFHFGNTTDKRQRLSTFSNGSDQAHSFALSS